MTSSTNGAYPTEQKNAKCKCGQGISGIPQSAKYILISILHDVYCEKDICNMYACKWMYDVSVCLLSALMELRNTEENTGC